jgi:hypothetical protein
MGGPKPEQRSPSFPRLGLQQKPLQMPRHFPALPVVAQSQHGQQRVDLVCVRGQQFALMTPDPRLPELAHFGVNAGQHERMPDADNAKQCAAVTSFVPGHALNRKAKQSRRESLAFSGRDRRQSAA